VHLVTNSRFADVFRHWASTAAVVVHDDGTFANEDASARSGTFSLRSNAAASTMTCLSLPATTCRLPPHRFCRRLAKPRHGGGRCGVRLRRLELATHYGIVELGEDNRIVYFIEKPDNPPSTLAATATYLYPASTCR